MSKNSEYQPYVPPQTALSEAGAPVAYELYQPGLLTANRTVLQALKSEGMPQEEVAIADAEFMLMDMEVVDGEHLDAGDTNDLLTLLGGLSLRYVVEREQLPLPGDDKRTLKLKRKCRVERAIQSGGMSTQGAEIFSGALNGGSYMLFHARETLRQPALLYRSNVSTSVARQGYVVDYSDEAKVRARLRFEAGYDDNWEEAYDIAQTEISPANFDARLEIGAELRDKSGNYTLSYNSLYRIIAKQRNNNLVSAAIESAESPEYVTREEMLFAIAILDNGITVIKRKPAYPEHDHFVKKLHKNSK